MMNASGHQTPPQKRQNHQLVPCPPTKPNPQAEAETQVVRDIFTLVCPSLGSDWKKMEVALGKAITRSPSGRIIRLNIVEVYSVANGMPLQNWHLPATITKLHFLHTLDLFMCSSIPQELATMETLKRLSIRFLFHSINLPAVDFPHVEDFMVSGLPLTAFPGPTPTLVVQWIGRRFINLQVLVFQYSHDILLVGLAELVAIGAKLCFRDSLVAVIVAQCEMTETDLSFFLQHITPHLPKLRMIFVPRNNINSLQTISRDVARANTKSCLAKMYLDSNPIAKKIIKSRASPEDAEDTALLSLLEKFPKLVSFFSTDADFGESVAWPPYASSKVEAFIRHRLTGVHALFGTTPVAPDDTGPQIQHPLPMASWPRVLHQSHQRSNSAKDFDQRKDASGTFYLLRHGPALIGRTHLFKDVDSKNKKGAGSPPLQDPPRRSRRRRKQTPFYGQV